MSVILTYCRFNSLLAMDMIAPTDRRLHPSLILKYSEYIKSQLHFPFTLYRHNRKSEDYVLAYDYLNGKVQDGSVEAVIRTVKYFYQDISTSYLALGLPSVTTIDFTLEVDVNGIAPVIDVDEPLYKMYCPMLDTTLPRRLQKARVLAKLSQDNYSIQLVRMN